MLTLRPWTAVGLRVVKGPASYCLTTGDLQGLQIENLYYINCYVLSDRKKEKDAQSHDEKKERSALDEGV